MKTKTFKTILMVMAIFLGMNLVSSIPANALPQYIIICAPGTNQGMYYNPASGQYCIDCLESSETCFCIFLYIYGTPGYWAGPGQVGEPGVAAGCLDPDGRQEFSSWDFTRNGDGITHYVFRQ